MCFRAYWLPHPALSPTRSGFRFSPSFLALTKGQRLKRQLLTLASLFMNSLDKIKLSCKYVAFFLGKGGCTAIELDLCWNTMCECDEYFCDLRAEYSCYWVLVCFYCSPLPKNLHLPMENDRSSAIQCRVALRSLTSLLRNWSSFVLLENHCYIKFIARWILFFCPF